MADDVDVGAGPDVSTPSDDAASADDAAPVDDATPVDDAAPVDDATPADDTVPADDSAPADDSTTADDRVYYVISDLHVGGDEQLGEVPFLEELLQFLRRLEGTEEDAELVINGDAFGLWELTTAEGVEKLDVLEETYPELFEQLRATGEQIPITLLPGNHDHELAAYEEYVERFAEHNVDLVQERSIERRIGDRAIHFEHGNQRDANNRIEAWSDPNARPLGYYFNTRVTSRAGQLSDRGRYNWLKDVQAVTPTERIPVWLLSKYFYREMHPLLRYSLVPFLFLFELSVVLAVLFGLDLAGIWAAPIDWVEASLEQLGAVGAAVWTFLWVDVAVATLLLLVGIPLYLIRADVRRTVERFGVFETPLTVDGDATYVEAAREVFEDRPETAIFAYGHTHRPGVREVDGRLLVNSGTWLKRLHRRDGVIGILPPVFYPAYQLCAVRIARAPERESAGVAVEFVEMEKPSPLAEDLTLTERLLTLGREPDPELPDRRVVGQTVGSQSERTPATRN